MMKARLQVTLHKICFANLTSGVDVLRSSYSRLPAVVLQAVEATSLFSIIIRAFTESLQEVGYVELVFRGRGACVCDVKLATFMSITSSCDP